MPSPRWAIVGVVVTIVALGMLVATLTGRGPQGSTADVPTPQPAATASPSHAASPQTAASSSPGASPSAARRSAGASVQPSTATAPPTPTKTPRTTAAPSAAGNPLTGWAEFLAHLNEDRAAVEGLNAALQKAAAAQDPAAVRPAAVAILDFVDRERDWLRDHPPADCFAAAHASALAMLDAYATAAERFVDWTAAGGGLAGLAALATAADAAAGATEAFGEFGTALQATTCPT